MLKNLIKYDLRFIISKALIIYYIVALSIGLMTRIFFLWDQYLIFDIIAKICSGATISTTISILINNVIRCWVRLRQNFYADESYLTHTLPIKKSTHYASKFLSALVSLLVSFTVVLITLLVAYYSKENFEIFKSVMFPVAEMLGGTYWGILLLLCAVLLVELMNMVQSGFLGTLIGHRFNSGKIGFSVLFGFVVYGVSQGIALFLTFLFALCFDGGILQMFTQNTITDFTTFKTVMCVALAVYILILAVGYFISIHTLKKGVNVD